MAISLAFAAPRFTVRLFGMISSETSNGRVLLIPEEGFYLAFRLPRLFCEAGWKVDLLCREGDPMVHSRYVSTVMQEKNHDAIFARLRNILLSANLPWQAITVVNEPLVRRLVATADVDLLKRWQPGAVDPVARELILSKFGLETVGRQGLVTVPPSRICETIDDIQQFGEVIGWPIIVKPPGGSGGGGVVRIDSPEELMSALSLPPFPMLAQKFIQGRRGVADMICSGGRPLGWLASYSIKRGHGEFSPSTARYFLAKPELEPIVEQVARVTRFEGLCGFDWIEENGTGRHYLIEFHPRPPSGFRFSRFCRVDFPAAIAAWLREEGANFPTQKQPENHAVAAHYFTCDLLRCFRQRDWTGLKAWLPGSSACHDAFWDDPVMMAAWAWGRVRDGAQRSMTPFLKRTLSLSSERRPVHPASCE